MLNAIPGAAEGTARELPGSPGPVDQADGEGDDHLRRLREAPGTTGDAGTVADRAVVLQQPVSGRMARAPESEDLMEISDAVAQIAAMLFGMFGGAILTLLLTSDRA